MNNYFFTSTYLYFLNRYQQQNIAVDFFNHPGLQRKFGLILSFTW